MSPYQIQVSGRKILLSPVTRRRDDRLMFTDRVFEFFDRLESDVVLFATEIDERSGVGTVLWDDHFDRRVRVDFNRRPPMTSAN